MNVKEAHANLTKLIAQGHGYLELIASSDQGDTSQASIYSSVEEVSDHESMGELCDWEPGDKYVPVYTGH